MASSHFLHSLIAPSTHFLLFPFAFLTFWFTFAVLLVPVMPVKRESGVNPEQTRCCKSSKASMASTPLCPVHGKVACLWTSQKTCQRAYLSFVVFGT